MRAFVVSSSRGVLAGLALAAVLGVSCDRGARPPAASSVTDTNLQIFQVKGIVREVTPERKQVRIAHEAVPNYMAAMTMNFDVKDARELEGLQPGDEVAFRMLVTANDGWIDQVRKTGATTNEAPARPDFRVVREVEPLNVGDAVPEYRFTNELGRAVNLSDFKGKAVALTFIFTRCPFPTFCPRMSTNFEEAYQKLSAQSGGPTNWHLLTLTFDPEFDTPAVLRNYAARYKHDPDHWSFLTGDLVDITAIAEQFGLLFWRPNPSEPTGISHNLRTVVLDPRGRVHKVLNENNWTADDLVAELRQAAVVPP